MKPQLKAHTVRTTQQPATPAPRPAPREVYWLELRATLVTGGEEQLGAQFDCTLAACTNVDLYTVLRYYHDRGQRLGFLRYRDTPDNQVHVMDPADTALVLAALQGDDAAWARVLERMP